MREPTNTATKRKSREDILALASPLFAQRGYDGVSMRDIASAVGLTQAALYYHFADKDQLYVDAVACEFREREATLKEILAGGGSAWERLEGFVVGLARLVATDRNFLRMMQWVLLDSNEQRQRMLAEQVFRDMFVAVHQMAGELASQRDPHALAISIFGLVIFPFETSIARQFMPGHQACQDDPDILARHVCDLLRAALSVSGTKLNPVGWTG